MWGGIYCNIEYGKFFITTFFDIDFRVGCNINVARTEMHILAYVYHWSRNEVMRLTRSERKMWVNMIEQQKEAEAKQMKG